MNIKELNQAFETIWVDESVKESVYQKLDVKSYIMKSEADSKMDSQTELPAATKISSEKEKENGNETGNVICGTHRKKASWVKRFAIMATILVALSIPVTIYADEIKTFFTEVLGRNEQVAEYVRQNVYEDSDGHLRMMVKELLSDQKAVRAVITYEALDEEGKEWIRNFDERDYDCDGIYWGFKDENGLSHSALSLVPSEIANGIFGFQELKEYRTDSTLCIQFMYDVNEPEKQQTAILYYPMTHKKYSQAELNVEPNMEIKEYRLVGDTNVNKYYDALYVRLSDLSLVIYGTQKGLYEHRTTAAGGYYQRILVPEKEREEVFPKVTLHFKDGTELSLMYGAALSPIMDHSGHIDSEGHRGADVNIYSVSFGEKFYMNDSMEERRLSIKAEDIENITINGHDFTLEEYTE